MNFEVKKLDTKNIKKELLEIGFDKNYLDFGFLKHSFLNLKIYNLTPVQATILKETALSVGCDTGVNRDVLTHNIEASNCILSGSISQIKKVVEKLKNQQFKMKELGELIEKSLQENNETPKIMGILNLSENSFSNDYKNPFERIDEFLAQNVDIIDIGAESTSPNKDDVDYKIQIDKILPVLDYLKGKNVKISIDTRSFEVVEKVIKENVDIINDVSFLANPKIPKLVLENNKKYVLTHSKGTPKTMNLMCDYENLLDEIYLSLSEKISYLEKIGFEKENVIVDVGFGFAKNVEQNIEIMKHIQEFKSLGCPILAGISRKRVIKSFAKNEENDELDFITALSSFYFSLKNVDILRVHNPYLTKLAINFAKSL